MNLHLFLNQKILSSIKVPPLKSIPKFRPLKINKINEQIINIDEIKLK